MDWLNWRTQWNSQSKGSAQVILLAPSPNQENPKAGDTKNQRASKAQPESSTTIEPKKITTQTESEQKSSIQQSQVQATSTRNTKEEHKKITAAQGDDAPVSTQSSQKTKRTPYEQSVYNHFLSKIESAPVAGSARLELIIMRAGVAISVKVSNLNGPAEYGRWLHRKALSINPYPPVPKEEKSSTIKVNINVNHLQDD